MAQIVGYFKLNKDKNASIYWDEKQSLKESRKIVGYDQIAALEQTPAFQRAKLSMMIVEVTKAEYNDYISKTPTISVHKSEDKSKQIIAEAYEEAKKIVEFAKTEAEETIISAKLKAEDDSKKIIQSAKDEAAQIIAEANKQKK